MEPCTFRDKRILITGAAGGLGVGLTLKLADMGARLILTARSETALSELQGRLGKGGETVALTADLSRPGEAADLARRAEAAFDGVDVLFNNAGVGYFALMEEATEENIRYLLELNVLSPIRLIQSLLPGMKRRGGGRIVNIVSAGAKAPIPSAGVYGGTKAALSAMADTLRLELEPTRIDVVNIYPGTIDTAFEENALRENQRPGLCPTDRCGRPRSDMAGEILDAAAGPSGEVWLERQGKFYSVAALLFPGLVDRRMAGLRDQAVKQERRKPRKWRLVQLESAIACNLRCVMCPWPEYARKVGNKGIMEPEVWAAIQPHLEEIQSIDFTGGGEPLMQPRLVEWITEAHAAGCETGFLTNGTLLTPEKSAAAIEAGVDWVCVSVDGARKETYEAIRRGGEVRDRLRPHRGPERRPERKPAEADDQLCHDARQRRRTRGSSGPGRPPRRGPDQLQAVRRGPGGSTGRDSRCSPTRRPKRSGGCKRGSKRPGKRPRNGGFRPPPSPGPRTNNPSATRTPPPTSLSASTAQPPPVSTWHWGVPRLFWVNR